LSPSLIGQNYGRHRQSTFNHILRSANPAGCLEGLSDTSSPERNEDALIAVKVSGFVFNNKQQTLLPARGICMTGDAEA
jgi:hypothetical protein